MGEDRQVVALPALKELARLGRACSIRPTVAFPILLAALAFLLGSLPFSYWLGRAVLRDDIRRYGDRNPGATNVYRAGGQALFFAALLLDVAKGAVPVAVAYQVLGVRDWSVVPIALAPVLGHAFSPFLRFRGGKALAVTLGVWIGLTIWPVPLVALAGIVVWRMVVEPTGWAVLLSLAGMLVVLLAWLPDPVLLAVLAGNTLILLWTHRLDLAHSPRLKLAALRRLGRSGE